MLAIADFKDRFVVPSANRNTEAVLVHRYVCCACGYSEEWIDKEDIPRLKEKYENA